jgi:Caspase domain
MPRGCSLHIGVVDPKPSVFGPLVSAAGADAAARAMAQIASQRQYTHTIILVNEQATVSTVRQSVEHLTSSLEKDDILFISFCGHGDRHFDGGDGDESVNQAFFLYDHRWVDDEIHELLQAITVDARVIAVFDACFSGSPLALAGDTGIALGPVETVTVRMARTAGPRRRTASPTRPPITANMLALSACRDDNVTLAAEPPHTLSPFSEALMATWATSSSYDALRDAIDPLAVSQGNPPPVLNADLLRDNAFRRQRPFAIGEQ